jgi:HSP20 family protein
MNPNDDDIIRDIKHLQETMERLLSDFSRLHTPLLLGKRSVWRPQTDVFETEKEYVIRMEIAGMDPADFGVTLHKRMLTIKGIRRDPTPPGRKHFHKMEISVGPFERNVEIPPSIRISSLEAHYERGYLLVKIAKGEKGSRETERVIPVERGS